MDSKDETLLEDIVAFNILTRVPNKVLLKMKCVCRKWHDLISGDPLFIRLHSENASSSLWFTHGKEMDLVSRDPTDIPILPRQIRRHRKTILASCNGLLFISTSSGAGEKFYVGNPVFNDWSLISSPPHSGAYGLAVDPGVSSSVCYKLVVLCTTKGCSHNTNGTTDYCFQILSSDTGMWKVSKEKILVSGHKRVHTRAVYVRGALYWKCKDYVMWFDPKKECGGLHPLPFGSTVIGEIGEWNGMLTYSSIKGEEIQIWSMNQSGWSKTYSVELEKIVDRNIDIFSSLCKNMKPLNRKLSDIIRHHYGVIPMPFQGGVLFFHIGKVMFWYDMVTREAGKHEIAYSNWDYPHFPYKSCLTWFPYKGTLISTPPLPT